MQPEGILRPYVRLKEGFHEKKWDFGSLFHCALKRGKVSRA